ncbi:uncharacterized protein LOC115758275 [Drosophila novamexicana]|uniref:uncharacterized protein LOC115758275 n=1 Tax=Drosophila novamexicana TaxID=47314 RepID=UPI0011E59250|nr:uncharacterized protein LOC115758275 [Drosophila novamexicana]
MGIILKKCCFWISLRRGCYIIAFVDLVFNMALIIFANDKHITHIERAMAICHCIGCGMLLIGALVQSTVLLVFYLITSLVNVAIHTCIIVMASIDFEPKRLVVILPGTFLVCLNLYSWVVVYSYFRKIDSATYEEGD